MDYTAMEQYWIWLSSVEGIGPKRFYQLLSLYEDARSVWDALGGPLTPPDMKVLGPQTLEKLRAARDAQYFYRLFDRLDRAGCRRLLSPCALMPWYPVVRTRSLWQAMAVPLTLTYLRSQGLDPRRSVVALRGDRMTRSLYKTCLALAGEVSALSLDLRQDDGLVWRLQQELGLPLVDRAGDVTLAFAPVTAGSGVLPLWAEDPEVAGFHLTLPGLSLPESCPELPVLSALLDEGRLPLYQVLVVPDFT